MKQHSATQPSSANHSLLKATTIICLAALLGACASSPGNYNKAMMEIMVDQRQSILATGYAVISIQHHDNPAQQRLLSIRASKLDAYRSLMEQVYGQYLDANTTVAEMVVESDSFRARVQGVIYGAQLVSITPVGDDTYETTLSLKRGIVDDLRVLYLQQLNSSMGS
tara:strand:+ start:348 stop:848 length:501 start_codon:yes stop_codon:yes gene_type:complete